MNAEVKSEAFGEEALGHASNKEITESHLSAGRMCEISSAACSRSFLIAECLKKALV